MYLLAFGKTRLINQSKEMDNIEGGFHQTENLLLDMSIN